jgi:hypothetical protein
VRDAPPITTARKRRFAEKILSTCDSPVAFVDVGAGGPLKLPWTLLPQQRVHKFDFDPEDRKAGAKPLCVSDHTGSEPLFVPASGERIVRAAVRERWHGRHARDRGGLRHA